MKQRLHAWVAAAHYLLGRKATALPDGVQVSSFTGECRIVPYSKIQRCLVRPVHESIRIFLERKDIRFHRVVLTGETPYAIKMRKEESECFIRHLKKYAPEVDVLIVSERIRSIQILKK